MSASEDWQCREGLFTDFLIANPCLDGDPDLQWRLHHTYWEHRGQGHRNALNEVMQEARNQGVTQPLYTDPETKRKIIASHRGASA
ncbi:putative endochitinase [Bifidobacterium saguini DSM 23967]|uniref:Uncharacterized protein n=2 Tax=Bifidobacterium saguini TaxID=762210 RepID=A0ABX7SBV0_9BIFI|nr:hypothetical protein [Bifidobacterium saguini]KFI92460.1 putative endochitinase [Bifidobacterium saguini DSM 23967]QTB90814.1 hypothetical protein BSD967_11105 [Bifidobacterium saguini]QTB90876.1 hypothetical protein BSD967_11440 [Bifidobacterium saguini]